MPHAGRDDDVGRDQGAVPVTGSGERGSAELNTWARDSWSNRDPTRIKERVSVYDPDGVAARPRRSRPAVDLVVRFPMIGGVATMKIRLVLISSLGLVTLLLATARLGAHRAEDGADARVAKAERARIQQHLAGAELQLIRASTASLTAPQQRARMKQIERLRSYARRGVYPHNHDFSGQHRPYFADRHGTLCAMAYLIAESGRRDIVDLVARARNNATVFELAADKVIGPVLTGWLREAGLTLAEAQRIQPEYGGEVYNDYDPEEITTSFAVSSAAIGALSLVTIGANSGLARTGSGGGWTPFAGIASGLVGVALGASNVEVGGPTKALAVVDMAVGGAAIIASTWALLRSKHAEPDDVRVSDARISLAPTARWSADQGPLIGFRARF